MEFEELKVIEMKTIPFHKLKIEGLGVNELKIVAKAMKINKYYLMKKRDLINAIEAVRRGDTSFQKTSVRTTQICEHAKLRYFCKECGGNAFCEHGKNKHYCKECGGNQICEHKKSKYYCKECSGKGICEHGKSKFACKECLK